MISLTRRVRLLGVTMAALGAAQVHAAVEFIGLTTSDQIVRFTDPALGINTVSVTGLGTGERLLGIDIRPSDGLLYGITQTGVYTIDSLGKATSVASLSASLAGLGGVGVDFNPVADFAGNASLRVVTGGAGNNYAVNVSTGIVGNTASQIASGYSAVAYTNSFAGGSAPMSTALYYINAAAGRLDMAPGSFNAPIITPVGTLGLSGALLSVNGFDILGADQAYAALNVDDGRTVTGIYRINLATGAATSIFEFNGTLRGLTVAPAAPVPEPSSLAMTAIGLATVVGVARRRTRRKAA